MLEKQQTCGYSGALNANTLQYWHSETKWKLEKPEGGCVWTAATRKYHRLGHYNAQKFIGFGLYRLGMPVQRCWHLMKAFMLL